MTELKYRTEGERVTDPEADPVSRGDPFRPHTEAERVADAASGVHPSAGPIGGQAPGGYLVGVEPAPLPAPLSHAATVAAETPSGRRVIDAQEGAHRIRGEFVPIAVSPEHARHERFLRAVAGHLGADPNPANLEEIARLLADAGVDLPDHEYPKMLYGRTLPDAEHGFETHVNLRHDHVGVVVKSEEDAKKLGGGWVENPADLPPRDKGA